MGGEDRQGEQRRDPFARFVAIAGLVIIALLLTAASLVWRAMP